MPDVIVIGGGIIGTACARELAVAGTSVTLLEKDELAAGASGRNLGYLDTSKDPVLAPLARASLPVYRDAVEEAPFPVFLDREPIGTLAVTLDEREVERLEAWVATARAVGVGVEAMGGDALRELEPELAPGVLQAWLLHEGHRVDPAALTVCLASEARVRGAEIRHHTPSRRLIRQGDRVTGVMTDDGPIHADLVVLAAGPWSAALVRPLGISLPIAGARGWLVQVATSRPLIRHWIQSGPRHLPAGGGSTSIEDPSSARVTMRELAEGAQAYELFPMIQPVPDGSIIAGSTREVALANDPHGLDAARSVAREAVRLVPALAAAPVTSTWSGVRPVSPDERPLIGRLADGLWLASGHGSEGVILGGGTALLVRAMITGEGSPFDPSPFDPHRFDLGPAPRRARWTGPVHPVE